MSNRDSDNEVWLSHSSVEPWTDPQLWSAYLDAAQSIFNAEITHLDDDDPVRRRITNTKDARDFITKFKPDYNYISRTIFGEIRHIKVRFNIWYWKDNPLSANMIDWHAPAGWFQDKERLKQIRQLFDLGNKLLGTFFGYVDTCAGQKANARKFRDDNILMSHEQELGSILWLNYFNQKYVVFLANTVLVP